MSKGNSIGNIANRATVDVSKKSPGFDPDKKLGNTAERSTARGSSKSPDAFGKLGQNTIKAVTAKGLDKHTTKGV